MRLACISGALALAVAALAGDAAAIQKTLNDLDVQGQWFYEDLNGAYAEAKKTGKPLLVAFR